MKTLAELIADAAANDDVQFTGPDGLAIKLGDIRSFRGSVDTETKTLKAKQAEAERVAQEAQKLLTALDAAMKEEAAKNKKETPKSEPDWKKNPLYEDLVPVFDGLMKSVEESRATAAAAKKELSQISAFYTLERLRSEYNAAPESYRKANTFESVVQGAITSGDMESFGQGENVVKMPTLRKRIHEGTEGDRIKAAVDAGVSAAKVEWDKAQRLNSIQKPQGRFATKTASNDKPPITKLDELTSEKVMNDPDITAAMEGPLN
jgi:hypothetical protein